MAPHFFADNVVGSDPLYATITDPTLEVAVEVRKRLERMWTTFEPYADDQFRIEIANQFCQRFCEMYLGCALLENGHTLTPRSTGSEGAILRKVGSFLDED